MNAYPNAARIATDDGWLPLHLVCRNSDSFEATILILEAYPAAASIPTPEGWFPLHQLCRYSHSLDAIKMVYEAYPEAAKSKTNKGSTPRNMLHKYYPLRADQRKNLINHDQNYKSDVVLALSVNVLDGATVSAGATASVSEVVALAVDHSSYMDITKFDDVCNLLK